ncbi:hypothetical protein [Phenylobacterium sp. J367]|uniref:hypothetical protein n=1 Tax=Phenylobacterium sp. J367 TaxID=2898435 RepID=UPI0021507BC9|nr:hypothetical protein [Phenylobacterium sp. J367]MCR5877701.1 hypothetical protein [Phenylobacterium sp. J367]
MRTIALVAAVGAALSLAACSQQAQDKTQAEVNETASEVKTGAIEAGNTMEAGLDKAGAELKDITDDPEVKRAASEAKDALKELGASIKDASDEPTPPPAEAK